MRTFIYGIKQGLRNIIQNKGYSLATIGTISICLFMFSIFYALLSNFKNIVYNAESTVGITVFFEEGISQSRIDEIGKNILEYNGVDRIEFISADEAWEKFKSEMYSQEDDISTTFGEDNPLKDSASYEVYLNDVSSQNTIVKNIKRIDGVRMVNSSSTVAKSLSSFNMLLAYVSVTIIVLLLLVSTFLISSTVASGINKRKEEISIMKLIGATDMFVRIPFLAEGVFIGLVGAVIPLVVFVPVYKKVINFIAGHFVSLSEWLSFVSIGDELKILIPVSIIVGIGIGYIGSSVSVRRNTKEVVR